MKIKPFWKIKPISDSNDYKLIKVDTWQQHVDAERRKLDKRLSPRPGKKKTHDMDDEMYATIDKMLQSRDSADVEIARQIIFDSNINDEHKDKLIDEHMSTLLYGAGLVGVKANASASFMWVDPSTI